MPQLLTFLSCPVKLSLKVSKPVHSEPIPKPGNREVCSRTGIWHKNTSYRWQDHVRNDEVAAHTCLRPVMESIRRRREAIFGHVERMSPNIPAHQHWDYRSRHQSVDDLTTIGSAALVAPATAGSTNSGRTISAHLLTFSEQPSSVVTLERRYGPRRLRDDDDDDA